VEEVEEVGKRATVEARVVLGMAVRSKVAGKAATALAASSSGVAARPVELPVTGRVLRADGVLRVDGPSRDTSSLDGDRYTPTFSLRLPLFLGNS